MQVRRRREQLQRIRGHAFDQFGVERRHQVEALRLRQACGLFPGFIEIATPLDHLAAEAAHGMVFF
ncbi:hypothetical protein D3C85_1585530 [compost metagenome]